MGSYPTGQARSVFGRLISRVNSRKPALGAIVFITSAIGLVSVSVASTSTSQTVAAARAAYAPLLAGQTTLPLTTPLKSAPARGKTIVVMNCGVPACTENDASITKAAAAVHWHVKILSFQYANPSTLVSAMNTALQYHPAAVVPIALPEQTWASVIPAYKAAGVPIIAEGESSPIPASARQTIVASVPPVKSIFFEYGRALGDWIVADSKAKASAVVESTTETGPAGTEAAAGLASAFQKLCAKCKSSTLNVPVADLQSGAANATLVSYLRSNPGVHYVLLYDGEYGDGLREALNAAGLSYVKLLAISPNTQDLSEMKSGGFSAGVVFSIYFTADLTLDAALRASEHMKIPSYSGVQAAQLIDRTNVNKISAARINLGVPPSYNYLGAWSKLWKVSK